jgi:hypothetical protein
MVKSGRGLVVVTLMEEGRGSWTVENLSVLTWFHLQSGHSIEPCRTE